MPEDIPERMPERMSEDMPERMPKDLSERILTYLPHKAVAEVSKDKEPIGRKCAEFNWFEIQLMSDSNELRVK